MPRKASRKKSPKRKSPKRKSSKKKSHKKSSKKSSKKKSHKKKSSKKRSYKSHSKYFYKGSRKPKQYSALNCKEKSEGDCKAQSWCQWSPKKRSCRKNPQWRRVPLAPEL